MSNRYEQPRYEGHEELLAAIRANDVARLRQAIIAASLYGDDHGAIEKACLELSTHEDEIVRGNAVLALGHIARRFSMLSPRGVQVVRDGRQDPSQYVRGQAHAAADDVAHFLKIDLG